MTRRYRRSGTLLAIAALFAVTGSLRAQDPVPPSRTAQAEAIVDALVARDFGKVTGQFDAGMKIALPGDAFGKGWDSTIAQVGAFHRRGAAEEQRRGVYTVVVIPCEFERAKLDVTVTFDTSGLIAGLQIRSPMRYAPPPYADGSAYLERDVTVGSGEWALPGTLTMPVGAGPFPAVVLVHGSGPNDRDESLGPNKTFRDLALGLGSRGVAVLRYDKRTLVYQAKLAVAGGQFTVKEESVDDAVAAVALLRRTPGIDPAKIFVIGHSLGGMIVPRIALADAKIAGLVVMAGAVRQLDLTILEQFQYLANADGVVSPQEQQQIDGAKQLVEMVAKLTPEDAKSGRMISGAPASYWLDLRGYDPPAAAARLPQRMLILQGARDYQVTVAEFERWKAGLAAKTNAQFRLYPALNHLFLPGAGKSLPAEYAVPGHVPIDVIDDIASWIKGS